MDRGSDARQKLVDAALDLFAKNGIDGVSLREITRKAGQGNTSALQYHFGDRSALLATVLEPYQVRVDERRASLIEALDARARADLRDVASALVRPAAAMLEVEGGKAYLRIMAEIWRDPRKFGDAWRHVEKSLEPWRKVAVGLMPEAASQLHRRGAAIQLCHSELGRRAATRRRSDHRLFVSDLVDLTSGVLAAPVSDETRRLLDERDTTSG